MSHEILNLHEILNVITQEGSHGFLFCRRAHLVGGQHCLYACTNLLVHAYTYHQLGP